MQKAKLVGLSLIVTKLMLASWVQAQTRMDTVVVSGQLITFANRSDLRPKNGKHIIDYEMGYFYLLGNTYAQIPQKKMPELKTASEMQNAVFIFNWNGRTWYNFQSCPDLPQIELVDVAKMVFPTLDHYAFRDKNYLFEERPLKIKCLYLLLDRVCLLHQLSYVPKVDFDKIPVFFPIEVLD